MGVAPREFDSFVAPLPRFVPEYSAMSCQLFRNVCAKGPFINYDLGRGGRQISHTNASNFSVPPYSNCAKIYGQLEDIINPHSDLWVKINPHKSPFPINPTSPVINERSLKNNGMGLQWLLTFTDVGVCNMTVSVYVIAWDVMNGMVTLMWQQVTHVHDDLQSTQTSGGDRQHYFVCFNLYQRSSIEDYL